jgi:hypothetical protein
MRIHYDSKSQSKTCKRITCVLDVAMLCVITCDAMCGYATLRCYVCRPYCVMTERIALAWHVCTIERSRTKYLAYSFHLESTPQDPKAPVEQTKRTKLLIYKCVAFGLRARRRFNTSGQCASKLRGKRNIAVHKKFCIGTSFII